MWFTLTVLVALLRIGNADDSTMMPCMSDMTTMEMTTMDSTMSPMPCHTTAVTTSSTTTTGTVTVTTSSTTPTGTVTVTTSSTTPTGTVTVTTVQASTTNSTANVTMTTAPATTVTTTITTTTPNWANMIDPGLKLIFTKIYPNSTIDPYLLYNMSRDPHVLIPFLDNITNSTWFTNCDATTNFLNYLISIFVSTGNKALVTEDRVKKVIVCKPDCNFATLFQANYTSNVTAFLKGAIPSMPKDAGALCGSVLAQFINITANLGPNSTISLDTIISLLPDNSPVSSILSISDMGRISPNDSALLIQRQGSNLDLKSAVALGANLSPNATFTTVVAASCCSPVDVLKNVEVLTLGNQLPNMNIALFPEKRMADMVSIVMADSTNRDTVLNQIISFGNPTLIAQIPFAKARNLPDLVSKPDLWPVSLALYKAIDFKSSIVSAINTTDLSNILNAVGANWIKNTTGSNGKTIADTFLTASTTSKFELRVDQRKACMQNYFGQDPYNKTAVLATFEAMNSSIIALISNSLIESTSSLLDILAQSSKFSQVITQNAKIPQSKCCKYLKAFRETYAGVAIKYLTNNTATATTVDTLDSLGVCFAGEIPAAYMSSLTGAAFMSRVNLFSNIVFQPNLATTQVVSTLLENYFAALNTSTAIDTAFNSLGSLTIFLSSTQLSRVSNTNYKSVASQVLPKIQSERVISNEDVQKCRLLINSDSDVTSRITVISFRFISALIASSRKRRSTPQYTCDQLTSLSGSLNQLTVSDITNSISTTEFYKCITLLGQTSNKWYSDQLTALAAKATAYYNSVSITSIPDTDISKLNSIMVGYTSSELSSLDIKSTGSVSTLGALNGWSTAQLTTLVARVKAYNSDSLVSVFSYMGNIACGMSDTELATIDVTTLSNSITAIGKISNTACPSLSSMYTKTRELADYSTLSSATVAALGSISGGITTADLGTLTADDMSSFTTTSLAIMPAATVNTMSSTQISGLSSAQLNAMINSDNYSGYSDSVKTSLRTSAGGSSASTISINMLLLLACLVLSSIFRSQ